MKQTGRNVRSQVESRREGGRVVGASLRIWAREGKTVLGHLARRICICLVLALAVVIGPGIGPESARGETIPRTIEVAYPVLDFETVSTERAAEIDAILRETAISMIAEIAPFGDVTGGYKVNLEQAGLLSVTLEFSGYYQPMAHPMHYRASVTIDLEQGGTYGLTDLFGDPEHLAVLSEIVREKIEAADIPLLVESVAISPDQDFYLTADALVIYFQLYEIAPYAWGFVGVELPYPSIAHLIHDESPLRRLINQE